MSALPLKAGTRRRDLAGVWQLVTRPSRDTAAQLWRILATWVELPEVSHDPNPERARPQSVAIFLRIGKTSRCLKFALGEGRIAIRGGASQISHFLYLIVKSRNLSRRSK